MEISVYLQEEIETNVYVLSQTCRYSEITIRRYLSALYYNVGILVLRDTALIAITAYSGLPNER